MMLLMGESRPVLTRQRSLGVIPYLTVTSQSQVSRQAANDATVLKRAPYPPISAPNGSSLSAEAPPLWSGACIIHHTVLGDKMTVWLFIKQQHAMYVFVSGA